MILITNQAEFGLVFSRSDPDAYVRPSPAARSPSGFHLGLRDRQLHRREPRERPVWTSSPGAPGGALGKRPRLWESPAHAGSRGSWRFIYRLRDSETGPVPSDRGAPAARRRGGHALRGAAGSRIPASPCRLEGGGGWRPAPAGPPPRALAPAQLRKGLVGPRAPRTERQ